MWVIYLLATAIGLIALKEAVGVFKIFILYKNQKGIKFYYKPLLGAFSVIYSKDKKDAFANLRKLLRSMKDEEQLVVINPTIGSRPFLIIKDPVLIKEFLSKDNEVAGRSMPFSLPIDPGFILKSGHKILKDRAIFANFFKEENLVKITPGIEQFVIKKVEEIKKDLFPSGRLNREFKKVELQQHFKPLFSDLVNYIMFGNKGCPLIDGKNLPQAVQELTQDEVAHIELHPLNLLLFRIPSKYKLLPKCKEQALKLNKIHEACQKMYKERTSKRPEERGCNMIDLMIEHNLSCKEEEILDQKSIIGNLILFQLAGMDTSRQVSTSTLYYLSKHPEMADELRKHIISDLFENGWKSCIGDYGRFDDSKYLNKFMVEALRMFTSAGLALPRFAKKNFRLGKYRMFKGSVIVVPFTGPHYDPEIYPEPTKIKIDRFTKEKQREVKNGSYLPFSSGNRDCLGRNLAQIFVRCLLCHFLRVFELSEDKDFVGRMAFEFSYGMKKCSVKLRLRE